MNILDEIQFQRRKIEKDTEGERESEREERERERERGGETSPSASLDVTAFAFLPAHRPEDLSPRREKIREETVLLGARVPASVRALV